MSSFWHARPDTFHTVTIVKTVPLQKSILCLTRTPHTHPHHSARQTTRPGAFCRVPKVAVTPQSEHAAPKSVLDQDQQLSAATARIGANVDFLPSVRIFVSFLSSLFRAPPRQICEKFLRPVTPCSSFAPFRVRKQGAPMLDQAPCGPAVPCLSRQARAAVMVHLRGEADAGHRSAVINERHVG